MLSDAGGLTSVHTCIHSVTGHRQLAAALASRHVTMPLLPTIPLALKRSHPVSIAVNISLAQQSGFSTDTVSDSVGKTMCNSTAAYFHSCVQDVCRPSLQARRPLAALPPLSAPIRCPALDRPVLAPTSVTLSSEIVRG